MAISFTHETLGQRVLFGTAQASEHIRAEMKRLGATRAMLIASDRDESLVGSLSDKLPVTLRWTEVNQHVPLENAVRARTAAQDARVDVLVAVGGGSTTGLAKAIALTSGLPIVSVPTTYSGSEGTNVWGLTENGVKRTGVDPAVLPVAVIYDAELTLSLPVTLSVTSGLNGLAHCVDALWAPRADPINQALGLEAARALASALRGIVADADDYAAREAALYGCYLAAVAFASAGSGLHHKICHVLGGAFDLPHAHTHAAVLPYVLAFNAPAVPEQAARLANVLGGNTITPDDDAAAAAVSALSELYQDIGAPRRLEDHRFTVANIPDAITPILGAIAASNPVPVTESNLTALLTAALTGTVPTPIGSTATWPSGLPENALH